MHNSVIEGYYKVIGDTRFIPIVEHKDDEIQWACSTSIYTDTGEPENIKESMKRPNVHLWIMSAISEVNDFFPREAWIPTKRNIVKAKVRKLVPVKWLFTSKEEADGLIRLKPRNIIKGYMQVPGVDFTESFSPVASYTS